MVSIVIRYSGPGDRLAITTVPDAEHMQVVLVEDGHMERPIFTGGQFTPDGFRGKCAEQTQQIRRAG